jgi:hypothetical protein
MRTDPVRMSNSRVRVRTGRCGVAAPTIRWIEISRARPAPPVGHAVGEWVVDRDDRDGADHGRHRVLGDRVLVQAVCESASTVTYSG